jgi:type IX secretion system PorP/SprF family membrane protein
MRFLLIVSLCVAGVTARGQYFQFSQFNFSKQRINPAYVASSNYASVSVLSRNQATDGGFHLNSNFINASYPFIARKSGKRWSGIGVSVMDDRSGTAGIFNTQEAALSYAINLSLSKQQSLSMGFKGLYHTQRLDASGLYTGSQYIPDRGFDESVASGENLGELRHQFFTFSAGLYWEEVDKKGNRLIYWSFSFFDFNKPENSFIGPSSNLNSTLVAAGGLKVYDKGNISVTPELLLTRSDGNNVMNFGTITSYSVKPFPNQVSARIDFITKYVLGRSGIIGIQWHRENFSVGFSYDFPVVVRNSANTSAFEIGLELRRLIDPKKKNAQAKKKQANTKPVAARQPVKRDTTKTSVKDTTAVKPKAAVAKKDMSERLRYKQDSIKAHANAGQIKHEPLVLEKATLHFNFTFASFEIEEEEASYLNELANAFKDNPDLRIKLTGHTDDVGSEKFNLKLSIQRAEKIREFLALRGVSPDRVTVDGKGESEPLTSNTTEEGKSKNRRVELVILYDQ